MLEQRLQLPKSFQRPSFLSFLSILHPYYISGAHTTHNRPRNINMDQKSYFKGWSCTVTVVFERVLKYHHWKSIINTTLCQTSTKTLSIPIDNEVVRCSIDFNVIVSHNDRSPQCVVAPIRKTLLLWKLKEERRIGSEFPGWIKRPPQLWTICHRLPRMYQSGVPTHKYHILTSFRSPLLVAKWCWRNQIWITGTNKYWPWPPESTSTVFPMKNQVVLT